MSHIWILVAIMAIVMVIAYSALAVASREDDYYEQY